MTTMLKMLQKNLTFNDYNPTEKRTCINTQYLAVSINALQFLYKLNGWAKHDILKFRTKNNRK